MGKHLNTAYISAGEFKAKKLLGIPYEGFVVGLGYAYIRTAAILPELVPGSPPLADRNTFGNGFTHLMHIQEINNLPNMVLMSLQVVKNDTTRGNDYFDIKTGEFLGSDKDISNNNIYLISESDWKKTNAALARSRIPGSKVIEPYSIKDERMAANIFNHYYKEAGFDLNELYGNSVIPQIAGNVNRGWVDIGMAEYYTGQMRILAEKHKIGGTLITRYDFINMFIHERGSHIPDLKNNEKLGLNPIWNETRDERLFERNAILMQVGHSSWQGTSPEFRKIIMEYAQDFFTPSEINTIFK